MTEQERTFQATADLQRFLRQLSYHDPAITAPPVDGIFASATRQSLEEFQKRYGLPVTGIGDQATWDQLYAAYRLSLAQTSLPREMALFPQTRRPTVIRPGDSSFSVAAIQFMLRELEFDMGAPIEISGRYDATTETAVRAFQAHAGLPTTGEVELATWNLLTDQYNVLFARSTYP